MNKMFAFMRESGPARALIPFGLFILVFGIIILVISIKNENYVQIEATVSNIELVPEISGEEDGTTTVENFYDVTVKYVVDEKEYEGVLNNLSKHNVGDKIKIYYNPSNPEEITQTKSLILPIIIIIGGLVMIIYGVLSAKKSIQKYKNMKEQEKGWANAN